MNKKNLMLLEGRKAAREQYLETGKVPEDIFNMYVREDPSKTKKYLEWMCKQYVVDPRRPEHIADAIRVYHRLAEKGKIKEKDINKIGTLDELEDTIEKAYQKKTRAELHKEHEANIKVLRDDEKFYIVEPKTHKASNLIGRKWFEAQGKKIPWCIAYNNPSYWEDYVEGSGMRFYYLVDKESNKKYVIQVNLSGSITAWDDKDKSMSYEKFKELVGL